MDIKTMANKETHLSRFHTVVHSHSIIPIRKQSDAVSFNWSQKTNCIQVYPPLILQKKNKLQIGLSALSLTRKDRDIYNILVTEQSQNY